MKKKKYLLTLNTYHDDEVMEYIRKTMRRFPDGNKEVQGIFPDLTKHNYSIINRGNTCGEIEKYRNGIEQDVFSLKRKNIVHAVEWVVRKPDGLPILKEEDYFRAAYEFIAGRLPMGEKCVLVSEVHKDEWTRDVNKKPEVISHMHILFIPAVPDTENKGYEWKMYAGEFTKLKEILSVTQGLRPFLKERGIEYGTYKTQNVENKIGNDTSTKKNANNDDTIAAAKTQPEGREISIMETSRNTERAGNGQIKTASLTINGEALTQALKKRGVPLASASRKIGYNGSYLGIVKGRGHIAAEAAGRLEETFH